MQNLVEYLKTISLFENLDEEILIKIAQSGRLHSFPKNTSILVEEEFGSTLFFIISGKVKVARNSEDGREVILHILSESEFFGEMAILDGESRSASVVALSDSRLFILRQTEFQKYLNNSPEIGIALIKELTHRLRAANLQIKSLSLKDAEGKIATVLIQLALDIGETDKEAVVINNLPVQQELANMAGTSRETVSRIFGTFIKKGMIEYENNRLKFFDFDKFRLQYK